MWRSPKVLCAKAPVACQPPVHLAYWFPSSFLTAQETGLSLVSPLSGIRALLTHLLTRSPHCLPTL